MQLRLQFFGKDRAEWSEQGMEHLPKTLSKGGPCSSCGDKSGRDSMQAQDAVLQTVPDQREAIWGFWA